MKKMVLLLLIAFSINVNAQTRFGVQGGILESIAIISESNADAKLYENPKTITGFKFGVFAEFSILDNFFINPEINFVKKGGRYENAWRDNQSAVEFTHKSTVQSIEFPVNLVYKIHTGNVGKVLIGTGPVVEYRIAAKTSWHYAQRSDLLTTELQSLNRPEPSSFIAGGSFEDEVIKPFGWGGNFFAGYEFSFGLKTLMQLRPDFSDRSNKTEIKYRNFYAAFGVGYVF